MQQLYLRLDSSKIELLSYMKHVITLQQWSLIMMLSLLVEAVMSIFKILLLMMDKNFAVSTRSRDLWNTLLNLLFFTY